MKRDVALTNATIIKRDGQLVPFDAEKISFAIFKALRAIGKPDRHIAVKYCNQVIEEINIAIRKDSPTVEETQDIVEKTLFENNEYKAAKAYIIYRYQHQSIRNAKEMFSNIDMVHHNSLL